MKLRGIKTINRKRAMVILAVLTGIAALCCICILSGWNGGQKVTFDKPVEEYSYSEFLAFSEEQQIAFQGAFDTFEDFQSWMDREAPPAPTEPALELPWEKAGAKRPEEYTLEEFEMLEPGAQIAFQSAFEDTNGFEQWLNKFLGSESTEEAEVFPWQSNPSKPLNSYTWAEYEEWEGSVQMAFQSAFPSFQDFENWLSLAHPEDSQSENPFLGRNLTEYTWEAFLQMTPEEQIAFQNAFPSGEDFASWMEKAEAEQQGKTSKGYPWNAPGGKQPEDYTWEEFENLTGEDQIAFQSAFDSADGFSVWFEEKHP